ncbi:hypothetical protein VKS41_001988 [Umbelopsis sp. WA50703]
MSLDSLYQPTAPPLTNQPNRHLPPIPQYQESQSRVLSTGFVDCCSPSNHPRNSYEEPRFHYPSHEKSFMKTTSIDHIPESERKGVLWTGSGVHVIAGGVKKVHTEIVGNITHGGMIIKLAGNQAVEDFSIQLDVYLMHVPDNAVSLSTEKSEDSFRLGLKTPKNIGFQKRIRAFWLITIPDNWLQPERLSACLCNSSIVGLDSLRSLSFGQIDLRTSNEFIKFETLTVQDLTLTTSNGTVEAANVNAKDIKVETSNAGIKGNLSAAEEIKLKTSNAPIEATTNAVYTNITTSNGRIAGTFTSAKLTSLQTSSGEVTARIQSPKIKVTTSNGAVTGLYEGDDVNIRTSNSKIKSLKATGNEIRISTSNGKIEGEYTAHKSISLKTSNATVESTCLVDGKSGEINVETSNGGITGSYQAPNGEVSLYTSKCKIKPDKLIAKRARLTTTHSSIRGERLVIGDSLRAVTTHSAIEVDVELDEGDHKIDIFAETSHARVDILVPNILVGPFNLTTSHSKIEVKAPNELDIVLDKNDGDTKVGRKFADKSKDKGREGKIQIRTSHSPINLKYV